MYYHLILTDDCNLACRYCRGKDFGCAHHHNGPHIEIDEALPPELAFDLDLLYRFLKKDPDPTLMFYGGEPLIRADLICEIMAHAPDVRFALHTNGQLLDTLAPEQVNRLSTLLISIDGPEELTDYYRGSGTYLKMIRNLQTMVSGGFQGEIIARMTIAEETDIDQAVRFLSANDDFSFSSIHWQIDANFSDDSEERNFAHWVRESYIPGIRHLIAYWIGHMRSEGEVVRWYPFVDTMQDLLLGRKTGLRCGSGYANYSIMTDGSIAPCPCMIGMTQYYLGHIASSDPMNLDAVGVQEPCRGCRLLDFCGGRCLYSQIVQPWPEEQRRILCSTVQDLKEGLVQALPEVWHLIDTGKIRLEDFDHPRFNGCEVIP